MRELRDAYETTSSPMVISGCVGPRFDGYAPEWIMSEEEAQAHHTAQIATFSATAADLVSAFTMTNVNEAIGVTRAAAACDMPVAISFTLETDGRLPGGETLQEAIEAVDAVLHYMINYVHPEHFKATLAAGGAWVARLRGIRANASRRSHAELDSAPDLDAGDPVELGGRYRSLVSGTTTSMCSAAAAAPITGMWSKSPLPAWRGLTARPRIPHLSPAGAFDIVCDVGDLAARQIHVRHFGMGSVRKAVSFSDDVFLCAIEAKLGASELRGRQKLIHSAEQSSGLPYPA